MTLQRLTRHGPLKFFFKPCIDGILQPYSEREEKASILVFKS